MSKKILFKMLTLHWFLASGFLSTGQTFSSAYEVNFGLPANKSLISLERIKVDSVIDNREDQSTLGYYNYFEGDSKEMIYSKKPVSDIIRDFFVIPRSSYESNNLTGITIVINKLSVKEQTIKDYSGYTNRNYEIDVDYYGKESEGIWKFLFNEQLILDTTFTPNAYSINSFCYDFFTVSIENVDNYVSHIPFKKEAKLLSSLNSEIIPTSYDTLYEGRIKVKVKSSGRVVIKEKLDFHVVSAIKEKMTLKVKGKYDVNYQVYLFNNEVKSSRVVPRTYVIERKFLSPYLFVIVPLTILIYSTSMK